ncbi:pilus assembly FimT family protein [Clostridium senegalense]|uniref:pilus assembly FimT family protein n=1 Tax=Clostridium senegalense TaxID=1465809 RepID=UPI001C101ADE|nr:hypothetical protein [Clostridium senegalense]MBU5225322.1 hypothetical protein [Clostridium senegalense]
MKKGLMLIEVLVTLSIILSILMISSFANKSFKKYEEKIAIEYSANDIVNFINYGKSYSRRFRSSSYILLQGKNVLILANKSKIIDTLKLPEDISITQFNNNVLNIKNGGYVSDACTIRLKSKTGLKKEISIMVGTNYVHIKK